MTLSKSDVNAKKHRMQIALNSDFFFFFEEIKNSFSFVIVFIQLY